MKKKLILTGLIMAIMLMTNCRKEVEPLSENQGTGLSLLKEASLLEMEKAEYDKNIKKFARALAKSAENKDFRELVKKEALLQIDDDYDVIWKDFHSKNVISNNGKKQIIDVIVENIEVNEKSKDDKKKDLLNFGNKYKRLQIAVPVHCDEWDTKNFKPLVAFLTSEYDESSVVIQAYNSNGNIVELNNAIIPYDPVIVISQNERSDNEGNIYDKYKSDKLKSAQYNDADEENLILSPVSLTGITTEAGIRLSWDMPPETNYQNISGYYVYRKQSNDIYYSLRGTISGAYSKSYDDNQVIALSSYSYYVQAFSDAGISNPSNYINITAPAKPKPVISFQAKQNSINEIELRWENDNSQFIQYTQISKHIIGVTSDYQLFGNFSGDQHYCFDQNLYYGRKMIYKINHVTNLGISNPKFDFVQVPYRDISQYSSVYIKQIKFTDWKIERWPAGKPEFYIIVSNIGPDYKPYQVQENINCEFNSVSSTSQVFYNKKVLDWKPGLWYDMLSFYAVEYDRSWGTLDITAAVGYNVKMQTAPDFMVQLKLVTLFKSKMKEKNAEIHI